MAWLDRYDAPELVFRARGFDVYTALRAGGDRELVAVTTSAVDALDRFVRVARALDHVCVPKVIERARAGELEFAAFACNGVVDGDTLRPLFTTTPFEYADLMGYIEILFDTFSTLHRTADPDDGLPMCLGWMSAANLLVGEDGTTWLLGLRVDDVQEVSAPEVTAGRRPAPASDVFALWRLVDSTMTQTLTAMGPERMPPLLRRMLHGERSADVLELREALYEASARATDYLPERRGSFDELGAILRRTWDQMGVTPDLRGWQSKLAGMVRRFRADRTTSPTQPASASVHVTPVSVLSRYELRDLIGAGGMGTVFDAWDRQLQQRVIVKRLKEAADWELRERFAREVRILRTVQHPNLVRGYDLIEERGELYAVMENIAGTGLESYAAAHPDPRGLVVLLAGVADGLQSLHDAGIVHRDVKPSNVIVHPTRGAVLLDYGVAHEAGSDLTRTDAAIGTPQYMAPEQLESATVHLGSDVYALALVVLRYAAGNAGSLPERLQRVWPALGDALRPSLARDPDARPRAGELAVALRAAAGG